MNAIRRGLVAALIVAMGLLAVPAASWAVPSFARQTGFSCASCHTIYPELTPLGRRFKLQGYVLTTTPTQGDESDYVLNKVPPVSAMVQASISQTDKDQPDTAAGSGTAQNATVRLPQQLSLFYAGRISPNTGAFIQITYNPTDDHFSIDNTDIRLVDSGSLGQSQLAYGLTLNNNPTVQDLWNSTPAWGFPYASPPQGLPAPSAAPLLSGGLAQQVAGLGGYAALLQSDGMVYAELSAYRSNQTGSPLPLDSTAQQPVVQDTAPYLRVAYEHNAGPASWEVGALSLSAALLQEPTTTAASVNSDGTTKAAVTGTGLSQTFANNFSDTGIDTQIQFFPSDENIFSIKGLALHEDQAWNAQVGNEHNSTSLDSLQVTGSYYFRRMVGVNLQYFTLSGTRDAVLYAANRTNKPDSAGTTVELVYNPWLNTRYSLQYTMYDTFNGASSNYSGAGRNASDNNTLYLLAWWMF